MQQAYSLLKKEEVHSLLTHPYTCKIAGETIQNIARMPWKSIYTFNVDNCFEQSIRIQAKASGVDDDRLEVRHFNDSFVDISYEISASIIHLHGDVTREADGYVFSRNEYARLMARANSWMLTLTQLIRTEPFVITGTTLDEVDVEYYLEQRGSDTTRSDVPPSILIEPFPDKLTERLCESHEFYLFKGTFNDFWEYFITKFGEPPSLWRQSFAPFMEAIELPKREKIAFTASFETAPKTAVPDTNSAPFLLGAPLSWQQLASGADIPREITTSLLAQIQNFAQNEEYRAFLLLDHPASGRSSLLRRVCFNMAKQEKNVFWFTGHEISDPESAARIFDKISGSCFVFVDNWADHGTYFLHILSFLQKKNIIFVGSERVYRRPYIEDSLAEENIAIVESQLDLTRSESKKLVERFEDAGLSGPIDRRAKKPLWQQVENDPIGVAACRIQKNFQNIDVIVEGLMAQCSDEWLRAYAVVGIARYCYSEGVSWPILAQACPEADINSMTVIYSILPITKARNTSGFLVPSRSAIADRVVSVLQRKNASMLTDAFIRLANALAPHVNRQQIRARSPAAKLAGGLMDFDRVTRRFINENAEQFYDGIKEGWAWNSRYWEQRALLKLDRYLTDKSDKGLLQEAIQNAKFAYSIERHPLSLTTLAKMLFATMEQDTGNRQARFDEAWDLITESIDLESKWRNIKATAFIVCFNGIVSYYEQGGIMSGAQSEKLRDIISTTYRRNLRDPRLVEIRNKVSRHIS